MMNTRRSFTLLGGLLIVLAASVLLIGTLFGKPASAQEGAADIPQQQAAWAALEIEAYRLVVEDVSAWDGLRTQLWISSGNVLMLRAECFPGMMGRPCRISQVNTRQYTVEQLFTTAARAGEDLVRVEFDPEYHYPTRIVIDDEALMDDQRVLIVTDFEVLATEVNPINFATATQTANDIAATATAIARTLTAGTPQPPASTPSATTTASPGSPTPRYIQNVRFQPFVPSGDLAQALDSAAAAWNALGIDSYSITLEEITVWNGLALRMVVLDGEPQSLEAECRTGWMRGPCGLWPIATRDYTVPGLFARARAAAAVDWGWQSVLTLDAASGIPLEIFYDEELTADEEWQVIVSGLTLLEAPAGGLGLTPTPDTTLLTSTPTPP